MRSSGSRTPSRSTGFRAAGGRPTARTRSCARGCDRQARRGGRARGATGLRGSRPSGSCGALFMNGRRRATRPSRTPRSTSPEKPIPIMTRLPRSGATATRGWRSSPRATAARARPRRARRAPGSRSVANFTMSSDSGYVSVFVTRMPPAASRPNTSASRSTTKKPARPPAAGGSRTSARSTDRPRRDPRPCRAVARTGARGGPAC